MAYTLSGSKPVSTRFRRTKLLMSSPAATTSRIARLVSATTMPFLRRSYRSEAPDPLVPTFSAPTISARDAAAAGARPNARLVMSDVSTANVSTVESTPTSPRRGTSPGLKATNAATSTHATPMPPTPPSAPSIKLSVRSCRTIRPRPAPIADRRANSRPRSLAPTNRRFATLAQAISSSRPTAPTSGVSVVEILPTVC